MQLQAMNPFKGLGERMVVRPGDVMGDGVVLLKEKAVPPVTSDRIPDEDAPKPKLTMSLDVLVLRGSELRQQAIHVIDFYPPRHRGCR